MIEQKEYIELSKFMYLEVVKKKLKKLLGDKLFNEAVEAMLIDPTDHTVSEALTDRFDKAQFIDLFDEATVIAKASMSLYLSIDVFRDRLAKFITGHEASCNTTIYELVLYEAGCLQSELMKCSEESELIKKTEQIGTLVNRLGLKMIDRDMKSVTYQ